MIALHHVQVACPPGGEDAARTFYGRGLGLSEVDKPPALRGRGGAWLRALDAVGRVVAELHVGGEDPFTPARKAHPAFVVDDLDAVSGRLRRLAFEVDDRERVTFEGYLRFHTFDPHGNRVEVLQRRDRWSRLSRPASSSDHFGAAFSGEVRAASHGASPRWEQHP